MEGGDVVVLGQPVDPSEASHRIHVLLARAGLPDLRFHDLRHAFATLQLAAGTDLLVVSRMLGHSTIQVTADVYAHILPQTQRDAADRLGALLTG